MPIVRNRRAEAKARGLISNVEAVATRASLHALNGDPLAATRLLRAAEQMNALDKAVRIKRAVERGQLAEARALEERERACDRRERRLAAEEADLNLQRDELRRTKAEIEAAYQLMREANADGPPPATEPATVSGVAPL